MTTTENRKFRPGDLFLINSLTIDRPIWCEKSLENATRFFEGYYIITPSETICEFIEYTHDDHIDYLKFLITDQQVIGYHPYPYEEKQCSLICAFDDVNPGDLFMFKHRGEALRAPRLPILRQEDAFHVTPEDLCQFIEMVTVNKKNFAKFLTNSNEQLFVYAPCVKNNETSGSGILKL
jgi:hypothetical protein